MPKEPKQEQYVVSEKKDEPKHIVGMYSELCIICKKKKCFYVLVSEEGKGNMIEIHPICSAKCEQDFRQRIKKDGWKKSGKELLTVVKGYDKIPDNK